MVPFAVNVKKAVWLFWLIFAVVIVVFDGGAHFAAAVSAIAGPKIARAVLAHGVDSKSAADVAVETAEEVRSHGLTERAKQLLSRLPSAVSAVGALPAAYEVVRVAAAAFGYPLPALAP